MTEVGNVFSQAFQFLYDTIVSFFPDSLIALVEVRFLINVVMVCIILYIIYFLCFKLWFTFYKIIVSCFRGIRR